MIPVVMLLATTGFAPSTYKAGVATAVITPAEPMWMSGYAGRTKPAEGKAHDLYAKAIALEDAGGYRLLLITTDLIGFPKELADGIATGIAAKTGLKREQILLSSSHTHCGPVLRDNLADMYDLSPVERQKVTAYSEKLKADVIALGIAAVADLSPATLSIGTGSAGFAINRRQKTDKGVVIGRAPTAPVDHSVPVLAVRSPDGKLRAAVFGYACHNTTLSYLNWCGDYAGFAQADFEAAHPGAVGLYWIGCGGDANPDPRGTQALAEKHGAELAKAVGAVVAKPMTAVTGTFAAKYETVTLPFAGVPSREQLQADAVSKSTAHRTRALRYLKLLDAGQSIPDKYEAYPVQVWAVGDPVLWVSLGGEVVIDYALRIRKDVPTKRTVWVAGYTNDVMAYIASKRVIAEGGYEAESSMIYYGMPGKWSPAVEDIIVGSVKKLAAAVENGK